MIQSDKEALEYTIRKITRFGSPIIYCNNEYVANLYSIVPMIKHKGLIPNEYRQTGFIGYFNGAKIYVNDELFSRDNKPHVIVVPKLED